MNARSPVTAPSISKMSDHSAVKDILDTSGSVEANPCRGIPCDRGYLGGAELQRNQSGCFLGHHINFGSPFSDGLQCDVAKISAGINGRRSSNV